jgi:hypothetical protein
MPLEFLTMLILMKSEVTSQTNENCSSAEEIGKQNPVFALLRYVLEA